MMLTSRDRELKAIAVSYGIKRIARVDRVAIKGRRMFESVWLW